MRLDTAEAIDKFVPLSLSPTLRHIVPTELGMAVDFSRFVLRMYVLSLGFLGTAVDSSRFVLHMYELSFMF
jgi:hypothetical protein